MKTSACLCVLAFLAAARLAHGEVVESSASSLQVRYVITVVGTPEKAWQSLVQVGKWWGSDHTYSGDASNLRLELRPGGCWCEALPKGGGVQHMTVAYIAQNHRLVLTGGLGPLQTAGVAGAMTFAISAKDSGSQLSVIYNVGGYLPGGLSAVGGGVDQVLGIQIARLQRLIETGSAEETKAAK